MDIALEMNGEVKVFKDITRVRMFDPTGRSRDFAILAKDEVNGISDAELREMVDNIFDIDSRDRAYEITTEIKNIRDNEGDNFSLSHIALYDNWKPNRAYEEGTKVSYMGILYKCLTSHVGLAEWHPDVTPSLWAKVINEVTVDEETGEVTYPTWEQPDSTNPYMMGDHVIHNGILYVSLINGNVWEPGTVGTENLWEAEV